MKKENKCVTVKNPCNQNWDSLYSKGSERYCDKCKLSVHDLTSKSNSQIVDLVMIKKGKICGRISRSQAKRSMIHLHSKNSNTMAYLVFLLGLSTISPTPAAERPIPKFESILPTKPIRSSFEDNENLIKQDSLKNYRGRVTGSDDQEPLPFVSVGIRGTDIETKTDLNGNFKLTIDKSNFRTSNPVLIFSYLGYTTKEIELTNADNEIEIQLTPDVMWIGEIRIPWYQRFWWIVKSPFI